MRKRNNDDRAGAKKETNSPAPTQNTTTPQGLNFVVPTDIVDIPSGGEFYHKDHPLHGVSAVEIRQMTAKEEDILTSKALLKQGIAIDRFLQSVLVDKRITTDSLLVGDKNALIVAARISGYGNEYSTRITCPNCTSLNDTEVDLLVCQHYKTGYNDKEPEEALDCVEGPLPGGTYIINLPITKAKVEVKLMDGRDERSFAKRLETRRRKKQSEAMLTDQFKTFIVSINGIHIAKQMFHFIDNLPVRDSRFLRNTYNKLSPAVELRHDFECSECGYEQEVEVPITAQFFWPDA